MKTRAVSPARLAVLPKGEGSMNRFRMFQVLLAGLLVGSLTSCGGGDGGTPTSAPSKPAAEGKEGEAKALQPYVSKLKPRAVIAISNKRGDFLFSLPL